MIDVQEPQPALLSEREPDHAAEADGGHLDAALAEHAGFDCDFGHAHFSLPAGKTAAVSPMGEGDQ
jgi:hypothetical protein